MEKVKGLIDKYNAKLMAQAKMEGRPVPELLLPGPLTPTDAMIEHLEGVTWSELEDIRRMTRCPAADSGWAAHAECKDRGDMIDWLVPGFSIVRDVGARWWATGEDGVGWALWYQEEGSAG